MLVVIDDKIPLIQGVLEPYAEVVYLKGADIDAEAVRDADALIIRTRTICNEQLLKGSSVKFIATATIGFDHIDTQYCDANGITWTNAPGCNSGSVLQYIASVLAVLRLRWGIDVIEKTIGIVGVGNVGSKVEALCRHLGMKVLLCDPPRKDSEGGDFVDYNYVLEHADIITHHVPLNAKGKYPTFHMFNDDVLTKLGQKPVIINTSRGEVVKTSSIKKAINNGLVEHVVLDVWENEPTIDIELLEQTLISTPHIAGYSADGKANGTAMSINALSKFFDLPLLDWYPEEIPAVEPKELLALNENVFEILNKTYNIEEDSDKLKYSPDKFEYFRGAYPIRREFGFYSVEVKPAANKIMQTLKNIGFKVK